MIPQLDNLGIAKPVLTQSLSEQRVGLNSDVSRVGSLDPATVRDVDVLPTKFDLGHILDQERDPSEYLHISAPLTGPSRKGKTDSASISEAQLHRLNKPLTNPRVSPLLLALGRRLAPVGRTFSPLAT